MTKNKIKKILIAVKPWEVKMPLTSSLVCLLSQTLDAEIALVSCLLHSDLDFGLAGAEPPMVSTTTTALADREQEQLGRLEKLAQPLRDEGIEVTTRSTLCSPIYQGILDEVMNWHADLLIVGVHEPSLMPHTRITDVDWQLMRLCPCPLLLTRNPSIESYRTILAAVDPLRGHAEPPGLAQVVLRAADQFSRALNAELSVVSAYPNPADYEIVSSVEVKPGIFYGAENIEEAHREAVETLIEECGIANVQATLRTGQPAAVIIELAKEKDTDLVVLGTIKRSAIESAIFGSTAESVIANATCDLLLVKLPLI